jgi:hypothetical protein
MDRLHNITWVSLCWLTNLRGKSMLFNIIDLLNVIDSLIHVDRLAFYNKQANQPDQPNLCIKQVSKCSQPILCNGGAIHTIDMA